MSQQTFWKCNIRARKKMSELREANFAVTKDWLQHKHDQIREDKPYLFLWTSHRSHMDLRWSFACCRQCLGQVQGPAWARWGQDWPSRATKQSKLSTSLLLINSPSFHATDPWFLTLLRMSSKHKGEFSKVVRCRSRSQNAKLFLSELGLVLFGDQVFTFDLGETYLFLCSFLPNLFL